MKLNTLNIKQETKTIQFLKFYLSGNIKLII